MAFVPRRLLTSLLRPKEGLVGISLRRLGGGLGLGAFAVVVGCLCPEPTAIILAKGVGCATVALVTRSIWDAFRRHRNARLHLDAQVRSFEHLVDELPIGVATFQAGRLVDGNRHLLELAGGPQTPEDRRAALFEAAVHPADKVRVLTAVAGDTPFALSFRLRARPDDERMIEAQGVPVIGQDKKPGRMIAYFRDTTEQKAAEAALRQRGESLRGANALLREAVMDLESNFQAMVQALVKVVEAKDPYTAGHSERVMAYSMWIAEEFGLSAQEMRSLRMGCLIHDVGKIAVPDAVLTKPDRLDKAEYEIIKGHPMAGVRMVEHIPLFLPCVPIVRFHHERLDGSGYPDRLVGDAIPRLAQITAVADAFDAMTSTRAYRVGLSLENALAELRRDAERNALDADIVNAFHGIVRRDGILCAPNSSVPPAEPTILMTSWEKAA